MYNVKAGLTKVKGATYTNSLILKLTVSQLLGRQARMPLITMISRGY